MKYEYVAGGILGFLVGMASISFAAQPTVDSEKMNIEEFATKYSGETEPESVPYYARVSALMGIVGMGDQTPVDTELKEEAQTRFGLDANDASILVTFFHDERAMNKTVKPGDSISDFCKRNRLDRPINEIDLRAVGHELNLAQSKLEQQSKDRFDKMTDGLSSVGRAALNQFIFDRVLTASAGVRFDLEAFLTSLPTEEAEKVIQKMCKSGGFVSYVGSGTGASRMNRLVQEYPSNEK